MRWLALAVLLAAHVAAAQPDAGVDAPTAPPPTFEPPKPKTPTDVPYPANAPAHTQPIVVTVKLHVDATGHVEQIERVSAPQPVFDDAVEAAAKAFEFEPGTYGGNPVPVEI